jgi:hypothetical protein
MELGQNALSFLSKKKRQKLLADLANYEYSSYTALPLEMALNILDYLESQIKLVEK